MTSVSTPHPARAGLSTRSIFLTRNVAATARPPLNSTILLECGAKLGTKKFFEFLARTLGCPASPLGESCLDLCHVLLALGFGRNRQTTRGIGRFGIESLIGVVWIGHNSQRCGFRGGHTVTLDGQNRELFLDATCRNTDVFHDIVGTKQFQIRILDVGARGHPVTESVLGIGTDQFDGCHQIGVVDFLLASHAYGDRNVLCAPPRTFLAYEGKALQILNILVQLIMKHVVQRGFGGDAGLAAVARGGFFPQRVVEFFVCRSGLQEFLGAHLLMHAEDSVLIGTAA